MLNLDLPQKHSLYSNLVWKSKYGNRRVRDMTTEHLVNVLVLAWNHSAPESERIYPHAHYEDKPAYSSKYMEKVVRAVTTELALRTDRKPEHDAKLQRIASALSTRSRLT